MRRTMIVRVWWRRSPADVSSTSTRPNAWSAPDRSVSDTRYAIYFVPPADSALYRLGSSLLGYDCYRGADVAFPRELPDDWAELTAAPRRYGFHGTLMAPFRLALGRDETGLLRAVARFADAARDIAVIEPVVRALGRFIAVVPRERNAVLDRLAPRRVARVGGFPSPFCGGGRGGGRAHR